MARTAAARSARTLWSLAASPRGGAVRSAMFDLAICIGVGCLAASEFADAYDSPQRAGAMLGFGMAVALLARRRWPLAVVVAVAVLELARRPVAPTGDPLPSDVAVLIAMYSVVKYARRMRDGWLAAGTVAILLAFQIIRDFAAWHAAPPESRPGNFDPDNRDVSPVEPWWQTLLLYVSICSGVWLAGFTLRTRRRYLASLQERAATAERERDALAQVAAADERTAIARDLHDIVAHTLAVMVMQADGATYTIDSDPAQARAATQRVADIGREAMEDMRRLVALLRGTLPGTDGEDHRPLNLDQLVQGARAAGLHVQVLQTGGPARLPTTVHLTVHRLVQEALTNVLRHAGPGSRTSVGLDYAADAVRLEIADDGAGRGPDSGQRHANGHGLVGMRERVAVHGGELTAGPRPGGGWLVSARVPLPG